jgi:WD40 repeat protein
LPRYIAAAEAARLLPHLSPEDQTRFDAAYHRDAQAYRLLPPPDGATPSPAAQQEAEALRQALLRAADEALQGVLARAGQAANLSDAERLLFEGSATHREIQLGLLGAGVPPEGPVARGALCAIRTFAGEPVGPAVADYAAEDAERAERVRQLTDAVLARLPEEQVLRYQVTWDRERGPAFDKAALAEAYLDLLRPKLEAVIMARSAARKAAAAQGRDAAVLANAAFASERLANFVGRAAPLAAIANYLGAPATSPLVVAGPGGSGKSTLLARVAEQARSAHPPALVLTRYIGVTPGTASLRTLLDGLCADLAAAYGHELEPVREDFEHAQAFRAALGWATAERPVILVVDALDQLGPPPVPLDWLPEALPPHVHFIVSTLDESDRPELATLQVREPALQVVLLTRMDAAEGDVLLAHWLSGVGRTLQPVQRAAVLAAFAPEGRPLQLRLAFEEVRRWRSFEDVAALPPLDPTIPSLVTARFRRLEQRKERGPLFTGHTLGLLRAAKNGLAEDELLALLARDAGVRWDLHRSSPFSPPISPDLPLPAALWAQVYGDLDPYLTEREADGARLLTYYHRQLADVASRRYLRGAQGRARHRDLARYFEAQPLTEGTQPNLRKLSEQAPQEAAGGLGADLRATLTDVSFLEQKLGAQRVGGALADLVLAPPEDAVVRQLVSVISASTRILDAHPEEFLNQVHGRVGAMPALHDPPARPQPFFELYTQSLPPEDQALVRVFTGHTSWVTACTFSPDGRYALSAGGGWADGDHTLRLWEVASGEQVRVFTGHTDAVTSCAFSPDGRYALSASNDRTLRLWEVASGQEVRVFTGHAGGVECCTFSLDGRYALSSSADETVRLWEVASGHEVCAFTAPSVTCCAFSPDGRYALSASNDRMLRLWEVARGEQVRASTGHTSYVYACAFSPDGRYALSASRDETLRLWEVATGQEVRVFTGHTGLVTGCAFSTDGRYALSASHDNTLRLWEVASGREVHAFTGHTDHVYGCALSPDGRYALSASYDHTLRLWEVASGTQRAVWHGERRNPSCAFGPLGDRALAGDDAGGVHLFRIVGLGIDEADVAQEPTPSAPHDGEPGPPASGDRAAPLAPIVEAKRRRKRFWFF